MKIEATSLVSKVARTQSAVRAGLLSTYGPAKRLNLADPQPLTSWGPAMRV